MNKSTKTVSVVIIAVDIVQRIMMEIKLSGWMIRRAFKESPVKSYVCNSVKERSRP